jgi:hypothetical protein
VDELTEEVESPDRSYGAGETNSLQPADFAGLDRYATLTARQQEQRGQRWRRSNVGMAPGCATGPCWP